VSYAPQTLIDLRRFLVEQTGLAGKNFSIRGSCGAKRAWGFHLGHDDIFSPCGYGKRDYSIQHRRNKRGLTNASAGFDIRLPQAKLRKLCAYLVEKGTTGWRDPGSGKTLLFEVIGPDADGVATRWARDTDWKPTDGRDDHEWHIHLGFWRDTEYIDKRPLFAAFFDVAAPEPEQPGEPDTPIEPEGDETPAPDDPAQPEIDPQAVQLQDAEELVDAIGALMAEYEAKYPDQPMGAVK
jgi:hypothetical protein